LAGKPDERTKLKLEYYKLRNEDMKSRIKRRKHLSSDRKETPMWTR